MGLSWDVYSDFTLKPYAKIVYTTDGGMIPRFLTKSYFKENPWMVVSIVGIDFLSSMKWTNDGGLEQECPLACDYQIEVRGKNAGMSMY